MYKKNWIQIGKRLIEFQEKAGIKSSRQVAIAIEADPIKGEKTKRNTNKNKKEHF